jgi:hypothetical protein
VAAVGPSRLSPHTERWLAELRLVLERQYPDLRVIVDGGRVTLRGSFPIESDGEVLDRYQIEVEVPMAGRLSMPMVREVGGRIRPSDERHVNSRDGTACPIVPEEWLLLPADKRDIISFLDGPVRNYFIGQSLAERGDPWPFGERPHGTPGLLESYKEILELTDETLVPAFLECLSHKKVNGHWKCPCGGGKPLRDCHSAKIRRLQERIPHKVAGGALSRLQGLGQ